MCYSAPAFFIFLEHFITLMRAPSQSCSRTATQSKVMCAEGERTPWVTAEDPPPPAVCLIQWTYSNGWQWPDSWMLPLTEWQRLLPPHTCGLPSRCNEIICYSCSSPNSYAVLAHRLEEMICDVNIKAHAWLLGKSAITIWCYCQGVKFN